MYLILLGWLYVVGMMAVATAAHPEGSWLQAILLLLFVGLLPAGLLLYIGGHGRRLRQQQEETDAHATSRPPAAAPDTPNPGPTRSQD